MHALSLLELGSNMLVRRRPLRNRNPIAGAQNAR
jgi:hypothetical protein